MVASFCSGSLAMEGGSEVLGAPSNIDIVNEIKPTEVINPTYSESKVRKIDEEGDLFSEEGMEAFLGDVLRVYSNRGSIKEDSVIVYKREDGSEVTFKASKENSRTGDYYFSIKPDVRGMWSVVSIDGVKVESKDFNFMTYNDIRDFNEVNNKDNPLLDENFMIKASDIPMPRMLRASSMIPVNRYSGNTRYETAVNICNANFTRTNTAIVVYGKAPSDALASTALAKVHNAPILYTENNSLNPLVRNELQRLGVDKVYVVGGESSISSGVVSQIYDAGVSNVQRISGARRSDTALALANEMRKMNTGRSAVVVDGYSENDCMAVATSSGEYSNPMVYANNGTLDDNSKSFIRNNYRSVFIMSGEKKINQDVINYFRNAGLNVYIKNESNSYNLSLSIARDSKFYGTVKKIYVAANAADGIPGSVLAARDGMPMLLVNGSNESSVIDYAKNKNINSAVILGGESSVSKSFENSLRSSTPTPTPTNNQRQKIVAIARKYLGVPYLWGGTDPDKGLDCSGFTMLVYKEALGIDIPRHSGNQKNVGRATTRDNLKPGDLIHWPGHVAIYIGGNMVIHAPRKGLSVMEEKIWGKPDAYRTLVKD